MRRDRYVMLSDTFPRTVGMKFAAYQLGVSTSTAYRWVKLDRFPCRFKRNGRRYVFSMRDLMRCLGIQDIRVYWSDVQAGVDFSGEFDQVL